MRRRQFIELTGLMTTVFWVGGFVYPSGAQNSSGILDSNTDGYRHLKPRMSGGRCHDHRLLTNDFPASFEREIFGI
ncbi:MAG: hypothetical protein V3S06_04110 [candidate division Zixibacteria bacterium]